MRTAIAGLILLTVSLAGAQVPPALRGALGGVANGDFAQLSDDGKSFAGWQFVISREAIVSVSVDATGGRGGGVAPVLHDESPLSPHVYGRFRQGVPVLPGMGYKLSFWCRAEKNASGNHWTDWKSYTLGVPGGSYDWTRVETRFVTATDQKELDLGLNVVDVTGKLWVDDVTLEPELTTARTGEVWLGLWNAPTVNADAEELPVRVWLSGAPAGAKLRIEVAAGKEIIGQLEVAAEGTDITRSLKLTPPADRAGQVKVALLDAAGKTIVAAERPVEVSSRRQVKAQLAQVREQAAALTQAIADWQGRGLPTDYPRVTATVAENFLPWIDEEFKRGDLKLAGQELDELSEALTGALAQCAQPPPVAALTVPRYTGGPIQIKGGHFAAPVRWPNGKTGQRPVFFMGYGHFNAVKRDVEKFPAYGLNIIQVEFGPNSVVQPDLSCNTAVVADFIKLLDRCEKAGVAVNLLLSPHYFPQWAYEKWPGLGGVEGGFIRFDVDAPQARQVEEAFLRAVIPMLKGHPALHSLCLSNEPIYQSAGKSVHNLQKWHEWLQQRHGDIAKLNALYGTQYASFDDVPVHAADNLRESPQLYDWVTFNNERFAGWHRWMADVIHSMAPEIPVHAKIMGLSFNRGTITWGNDPEQFCDLSQIAGNDCWNWVQRSESSPYGNDWRGEYQFYDLLRSMRGQPVFNSENHVVLDRDWGPVPGMHMRNLIWQGALHGMGASTMWVWERTTDPKSDFAGSVMHRPVMCDAHGRTALDLMRLAPEMVALQDQPARVALVYSLASMTWNQQYTTRVAEAYEALTLLGEKVDFLTWRQLAQGAAKRYRAVILPGVTNLEPEGFEGLAAFASTTGKRVVAIGETGLADEYNRVRDFPGLPLTKLASAGSRDLAPQLRAALQLDWPVQVKTEGTPPTPFVGFRWTRSGGRWLVNVCNYSRQPVQVRVAVTGAKRLTNLLTAQPVTWPLTLQSLEPVLVEAR